MVTISFKRDFQIPVWLGHEAQLCKASNGDHAGQWETSVTMALEPDTVDQKQFPKKGKANPAGVFGKPIAEITPELAAKNLQMCIEGMVKKANALLEHATTMNQSN